MQTAMFGVALSRYLSVRGMCHFGFYGLHAWCLIPDNKLQHLGDGAVCDVRLYGTKQQVLQ